MQAVSINDDMSAAPSVIARNGSWSSRIASATAVFVVVLVTPIFVFAVLNRHSPDTWAIADPSLVIGALAYVFVGMLIVRRQPSNLLGWLFLFLGTTGQISSLIAGYAVYSLETNTSSPGGNWALWLNTWISVSTFMPMFPLLLFPSGRLHGRVARIVAGLTLLSTAWLLFSLLVGTTIPPGFPDVYNRTPNPLFPGDPIADAGAGIMALGLCGLISAGLVLYRFAKSDGMLRQQYMWIVMDMCFLVLTFVGDFVARGIIGTGYQITSPLMNLSIALLPVAAGIAILRYHLFDIEFIFSRAIVYLVMTITIVAIYIFAVGWLGTLFRTGGNLVFSLFAAGIVAVLFHPLRETVQRRVNRILFGERDEPYAAIARLGQRLENTLAADAILPAIAGTVREALKLPYAAVSLTQGVGPPLVVETGSLAADPLRLPLLYQQEPVGELLLGPRTPGEAFGPADRRLLDDLARQAGIAVNAVRLTHDLQLARERLVEAREEERRRLHRDLHDGLGSQLAALSLQLGALPALIDADPPAAQLEVSELRGQLRTAITSIRALVQGLRPLTIDELGLAVALRERIRQFSTPDITIRTDLPNTLPPLPAAVEVAVYRVTEEALANVVKHALARACLVRLSTNGSSLLLTIEDDGIGLAAAKIASGVGMHSMRERAEELGGSFEVVDRPGGGTSVEAIFPIGLAVVADE
ncbi:MAG: GAF domain-containing sensor histidine kinase [Nitrolancea sp.]